MKQALIACDSSKATEFYREFLVSHGFLRIDHTDNGEEAKRLLSDGSYDVCVLHAPIGTKGSVHLAKDIARKGVCQIILFVKAEEAEAVAEDVINYGIFTIPRPISKSLFHSALMFSLAANERMQQAEETIRRLEKRLREQESISRAKCLLIEEKGFSEEKAHKYIEHRSMEEQLSRIEIAREIIDFYG